MIHSRRPHQIAAVRDVISGFEDQDRGQLIMACGTGKTLTTRWVVEDMNARLTLVLVPSIALLDQFAAEWRTNASPLHSFEYLCVCSDETLTASMDALEVTAQDLQADGLSVASDPQTIVDFMLGAGRRVIFSTYQSSHLVATAQSSIGVPAFDIVVADEAHKCAAGTSSVFSTVLYQDRIRARKRLFATATPRIYRRPRKTGDREQVLADMGNVGLFGPRFHTLDFRRAIELGLLCDYQVVVVLSDDEEVRTVVESSGEKRPAESSEPMMRAATIGLHKAIEQFELRKVITFHRSLGNASRFRDDLVAVSKSLRRPESCSASLHVDFLSGAMKANVRRAKLADFRFASPDTRRVITNARCLTEGVDVPSVDGIAFIDPRSSEIDIVQALGRALRRHEGKMLGTIVLPIFLGRGDSASDVIQNTDFRAIWNVLSALRSHDDELASSLVDARNAGAGVSNSGSDPFAKVHFFGSGNVFKIADALRPVVVAELTSTWDAGIQAARARAAAMGDCNASHGERWPSEDPNGFPLGEWLSAQRRERNRGHLSQYRGQQLEAIGIVWSLRDARWQVAFDCAREWIAQRGHGTIPTHAKWTKEDGTVIAVGSWANEQRSAWRSGTLSPERVERLTAAGFTWAPLDDSFEQGFSCAKAWHVLHGNCNAPESATWPQGDVDGFRLGAWIKSVRVSYANERLSEERQRRLEALGINWRRRDARWDEGFSAAAARAIVYGDCNAPQEAVWPENHPHAFDLGRWLVNQRRARASGELDPARVKKLDSIGMHWDLRATRGEQAWERAFACAQAWFRIHGTCNAPPKARSPDGFWLGQWIFAQRSTFRAGRLHPERTARLEQLGMVWQPAVKRTPAPASSPIVANAPLDLPLRLRRLSKKDRSESTIVAVGGHARSLVLRGLEPSTTAFLSVSMATTWRIP